MECEICKNTFTGKHNLLKHQRTAIYCLKLKNKDIQTVDTLFKCICSKTFTSNENIVSHQKKCIEYHKNEWIISHNEEINNYKSTIAEHKNTIKDLQNTIEKLATHAISRPTISTTKNTQINYIQQMKPVIDDELKDNAQNLTIDHILKGPEGYAQYALEYPLKDRVCCVDYARRKVKFKDPNGNVITDPEMSTLATKFFQSIKDKNKDLIIEYGTKLNEHLGEHLQDLIDILDIKSGVDNGADGSKTEFYHDFVKNICGKTIIE